MKLRARVIKATGKCRHYKGGIEKGELVRRELMPPPKWVEIEQLADGFYLFYYNERGECQTDTWHETLEAAKEMAKWEFQVNDADWVVVEP